MKKPIIFGVLGLLIGYAIYLLIYLFSSEPVDRNLGVLIALITGALFFFIGRWYFSRGAPK